MIKTATHLSYANGYIDLGMLKEAKRELDFVSEEDRHSVNTMSVRGRLYMETKEWKKVVEVASSVVKKNSAYSVAWVNWAYALRELDQIEKAKGVALNALKLHPKEAILWFNMACYHSLLGDRTAAMDSLKKAVLLDKQFDQLAKEDEDLKGIWDLIK